MENNGCTLPASLDMGNLSQVGEYQTLSVTAKGLKIKRPLHL